MLPLSSPGYLPDIGIKPGSPGLQADSLSSEPPEKLLVTLKPPRILRKNLPYSTFPPSSFLSLSFLVFFDFFAFWPPGHLAFSTHPSLMWPETNVVRPQ